VESAWGVLQVVDPVTGEFSLSNVFQFTFKLNEFNRLPQLVPRTYHEVFSQHVDFLNIYIYISVKGVWS
jgi:hypothetical protein